MRLRVGKWLLFALCAALGLSFDAQGQYAVVPMIAAVVPAALAEALPPGPVSLALPCLGALSAFFYPPMFFYLPVFVYDLWLPKEKLLLACLVPALTAAARMLPAAAGLVLLLCALAAYVKHQTDTLDQKISENHALRDDGVQLSRSLRESNAQLRRQQDETAKMAALKERARIARELHDSVGHVLSSALLQTGALLAISRDEQEKERLSRLNRTLSEGMDEVRAAVHRLRDEGLDLRKELEKLTEDFRFCRVWLEYDMGEKLPAQIAQAFIAIVREGLSNVARHSNADRVCVTAREHPAFYQLSVLDNGRSALPARGSGMGLENIRGRVEQLGGLARIGPTGSGFEIFVSVRKGEDPCG